MRGVSGLVAKAEHLLTIHEHSHSASHNTGRVGGNIFSPLLQMWKLSPRGMNDPPEVPQLGRGGARAMTSHYYTQSSEH